MRRLPLAIVLLLTTCFLTPLDARPKHSVRGANDSGLSADERRERANERERKALPKPLSDEPKIYNAWLRKLPRKMRYRVMRFCRRNPTNYEDSCGGIGPLHIPTPPTMLMKRPRPGATPGPTRAEWRRNLSRAQRRYVKEWCSSERYAFTQLCGATPLVVSFHDQPVAYTRSRDRFAFLPGDPVASDWPTATTPWIARDLDGNGTIDSGAELFGSNTVLANGTTASNGFTALAPLDANGDGRLDKSDPQFASLVLWADHDGDRKSSPDELTPLSKVVVSISLDYAVDARCDARGNCERERSTVTWRDGSTLRTGSVVDVHLPIR